MAKIKKEEIQKEIIDDEADIIPYEGSFMSAQKMREKTFYPTNFRNIDTCIGKNIYSEDDKFIRTNRGVGSGAYCTFAGKSGIGKTTLAIQMGSNILRPLINTIDGVEFYMIDVERGITIDRFKSITNFSNHELDKITRFVNTPYIETLGDLVNEIIEKKKASNLKYKALNMYNEPIDIYVPTVVVVDSLTQMPAKKVYEEEKQDNTDALMQMRAIDRFFKLYRDKMVDYNIIMISICAIAKNLGDLSNPMARPVKVWKGVPADVKILGGMKNAYSSDIGIYLDRYMESEKAKLDKTVGYLDSNSSLRATLFKSRQSADTIDFYLVSNLKNEFDAINSFMYECQKVGIITSAGSVKKIQGFSESIKTSNLMERFREDINVRKALLTAYDDYRKVVLDSTRKSNQMREQIIKDQLLLSEEF